MCFWPVVASEKLTPIIPRRWYQNKIGGTNGGMKSLLGSKNAHSMRHAGYVSIDASPPISHLLVTVLGNPQVSVGARKVPRVS